MDRLAPKICQWHRDAYCGSVFEHYIQFGAPAADRRTLEMVLSFYNVENETFSIPDGITGETKIVNFSLDWVHNHTFFPIDGEIICTNRDAKCRIWVEYFVKLFKKGKPTISIRRYVEGQLERLVESTEKKDIQDFVLLQILYQCSMIWCPRSGEGIPRTLLKYMDSIERVNRVAWGRFIYSEIIRGIKVAVDGLKKPGVTYIPGCMPLIPLWYYEMTGIKKYAYSHRFRPPMTNWVVEGEKAGSLRKGTIAAKAKTASVTLVEKPIVEVGPVFLKYQAIHPHGRIDESSIPHATLFPPPVQRTVIIPDKPKLGVSGKISKSKAKKEETKKTSIGYIIAQHIEDSFEKEDQVEALPIEDQLVFWRNSAKLVKRLLSATKRSKGAYCTAFMAEISRLNRIVESCGRGADVIDPMVLKENIKKKLVDNRELKSRTTEEEHHSHASFVQDSDKVDDIVKEVEEEVVHKSRVEEEVVHKNRVDEEVHKDRVEKEVIDKGKIEEEVPVEEEETMNTTAEEDVPIEDRVEDVPIEERVSVEFDFGDEFHKVVHKEAEDLQAEEKEGTKDVKDQLDKLVEGLTSAVQKEEEKVASKKSPPKKIRARSKRVTKRSQHVRTPYTEGKKKNKKDEDIIEVPEHGHTAEKPIKVYFGNQEAKWDVLKGNPITNEEETLLNKLNEGIPDPSDFCIRIIDSMGTFVHNYRIPPTVSSMLNTTENECLTHFCYQKCHKRYAVISLDSGSMNREELLYMLRGGRLDDSMEETLLARLQQDAYEKSYGLVSVFFCHSLYAQDPEYYMLFLSFFEKYTAVGIERLLIPLVRNDHWHLVEADLKEKIVRHYSSASHEPWMEPVNKIINFLDLMQVDFVTNKVRRVFGYKAIKCEQQKGSYDCGLLVYLYIKAIIHGRPTFPVTADDSSELLRARIAAGILIEGRERRQKTGTLYEDE